MENQVTGRSLLAQIISDLELPSLATDRLTQAFEAQLNAGLGTDRVLAAVVSQIPGVKQKAEEAGIELGEFVSDAVAEATETIEAGEGVEIPGEDGEGEDGEGEDGETPDIDVSDLTSALASLDAANKDKDAFLVSALDNADVAVKAGSAATTASKANITDALGDQVNALKVAKYVNDDNFGTRDAALQDSLIAAAEAKLNKAITTAQKDVESGSEALLDAIDSAADGVSAATDAVTAATKALSGKNAEFKALTGNKFDGTDASAANKTLLLTDVGGAIAFNDAAAATPGTTTLLAELEGSTWVIKSAGQGVDGLADYIAALNNSIAKTTALGTAEGALKAAIIDVYLAENGDDDFTYIDPTTLTDGGIYTMAGKLAGGTTVTFTGNDLTAYKSEDDAGVTPAAQEFVFKIGTAGKDGDTFTFAGQTLNFTDGGGDVNTTTTTLAADQATAIASKYATDANWTVSVINSDELKFVAKANKANIPDTDMPKATGTLALTEDASAKVDGVAALDYTPETITGTGDIGNAKALLDAKKDLADFNEAVEKFEVLRDLNNELISKEEAITQIETWLTDNDYNLVKSGITTATNKSDIFTFSNLSDGDTINNFGAKYGEDGADFLLASDFANYSVVEVAEGTTLAATIFGGDATKLEVFALETSTGVELYFEKEAAAGNLKAGAAASNFDVITLTGVTTEDLSFTDGVFAAALA